MTLNEIINSEYKVSEKINLIDEYKSQVLKEIEEANMDVVKDFKYCERCKEFYRKNSWDIEYKNETRRVCTYKDAGYGDDDEYSNKEFRVKYYICPIGHKIKESETIKR